MVIKIIDLTFQSADQAYFFRFTLFLLNQVYREHEIWHMCIDIQGKI